MRVLVASTRKVRFDAVYSARWMPTVSPAGLTVSVALREMPFKVALMVEVNCEEIDVVLIVKVALVAPAGMDTLAGTETIGAPELARLIVVGTEAAALKVIVPCDVLPPRTLAGFKVNDDMTGALAAGGVTVRIALLLEPPKVAVIVTCVGVLTAAAAKSVKAEF